MKNKFIVIFIFLTFGVYIIIPPYLAYAANNNEEAHYSHAPEMPDDYNIDPDDFPDALQFRPENASAFWSGRKAIEIRRILDEMFANNMRDNFLVNRISWRKLEENAHNAAEWVRLCEHDEYDQAQEILLSQSAQLSERKEDLINLKEDLKNQLRQDEIRLEDLHGEHNTLGRVWQELQEEGYQAGQEYILRKLIGCAGTALGVAYALWAVYETAVVAEEWGAMEAILPGMIEKAEAFAYLSLLIKQYEDLEEAYDALAEYVEESFDEHACEECTHPEIFSASECVLPRSEEETQERPDFFRRNTRTLPSGQRLMESGSGEKTLMGSNGKLQATIEDGTTTIYGANGVVTQIINQEMSVEAINQILETRR